MVQIKIITSEKVYDRNLNQYIDKDIETQVNEELKNITKENDSLFVELKYINKDTYILIYKTE
jgi:hypothetical protein